MKTKITFEEALVVSETLFGIFKEVTPEGYSVPEIKSLFLLKRFKTNNLKEIKEMILKDFYHVPKQILEVKIAKTIKKLLAKEVISKVKNKKDKRQLEINITPKGEKIIKEVKTKAKANWEEATND